MKPELHFQQEIVAQGSKADEVSFQNTKIDWIEFMNAGPSPLVDGWMDGWIYYRVLVLPPL